MIGGVRMTVDRIFFIYMVLVGIAAGAILVAAPQVQDFVIKPYFWILIAVGLFDGGIYLLGRTGGYSVDRRRAGAFFLTLCAVSRLPLGPSVEARP
jgi:hypothetical protein